MIEADLWTAMLAQRLDEQPAQPRSGLSRGTSLASLASRSSATSMDGAYERGALPLLRPPDRAVAQVLCPGLSLCAHLPLREAFSTLDALLRDLVIFDSAPKSKPL